MLRRSLAPVQAILLGTLTVGVLDLVDAIVFFRLRSGVAPIRIPQSIAAGALGRAAAFRGGLGTAALGVALHFFIAFGIVTIYWLASRRLSVLVRRPFVCGPLYGLGVYAFMNYVVVPLSAAASSGSTPLPVLLNGLIIHVVGVGLPSALFARASRRMGS